jgi:ubiquinone/menaquinone biosynthesis C-methylase UbiE
MSLHDNERLESLYNSGVYASNTSNWQDHDSGPRARALLKAIETVRDEVATLVDIGCGSGGVIMKLVTSGEIKNCSFAGYDLSQQAIAYAATRDEHKDLNTKVHFSVGSFDEAFRSLSPDDKYDLVSLIHVLEHCPDLYEALRICSDNAKYIYINVPVEITPLYVFRRGIYSSLYRKYGHLHFFTEDFLDEFLKTKGFNVVAKGYSFDYQERPAGPLRKILNLVRRAVSTIFSPSIANKFFGGISVTYLLRS